MKIKLVDDLSKKGKKKLVIFKWNKWRSAGYIEGNIYYTIRLQKHYFRKYNGFGISEGIIKYLKELDIKIVLIYYVGKQGITYHKCPLTAYETGICYEDPTNRGDSQRIVSVHQMERLTKEYEPYVIK